MIKTNNFKYSALAKVGVESIVELKHGEIKGVVCEYDELVARCDGTFVEQGEDRDSC